LVGFDLVGPRVADRRLKCRGCGSEIPRGSEYWVEEGYEERVWVGFNPRYGAPSFRHPTRTRRYLRRRVLCGTCKEKSLEALGEGRAEERRRREEIDRMVMDFIHETLREETDTYTLSRKFRERFPKDGYDARTGRYVGPTISHVIETVIKLAEEGVVERTYDEGVGWKYSLKRQERKA
jgi:hypothetical protein